MKKRKTEAAAVALSFLLWGCSFQKTEPAEAYTEQPVIMQQEDLPEGLSDRIEEEKEDPFLLAWGDGSWLYIAVGYGRQDTEGYRVELEEISQTRHSLIVRTTLTGPGEQDKAAERESFPWLAFRIPYTEKRILSER